MTDRNPFLTAPFAGCIFRRPNPSDPIGVIAENRVRLGVIAPELWPDEEVAIVGSSPQLGCWETSAALPLNDSEFPLWQIDLPVGSQHAEYKFIIRNRHNGSMVWEEGPNRYYAGRGDMAMKFRYGQHRWRGSGVAVPIFSLRSESDFGVGDFYDLKLLADWAKSTGQSFIQILPVNDTTMSRTNADSYPYNANSTFALHPMYLSISELGPLDDPTETKRFEAIRAQLNSRPIVDYSAVNKAKEEYVRRFFAERGEETITKPEFADFVARNASWLMPYAAWCTLRDRYNTADSSQWNEYAVYSSGIPVHLLLTDRDSMLYNMFVQYHLDRQLREAHDYARSIGVAIKGDIPIGISSSSVDAWQSPELFNLDMQAGAPPDDFAVLGQNWGFPTYNWKRMASDGYMWWRQRLTKMAEYFDAYRIDHVLGFFRIWQIPRSATHGLLGYFSPALPLSAEEMIIDFGFNFNQTMLMPGMPTGGYSSQADADAAGDRLMADAFDDVLFIADPSEPGRYHPRIKGHDTSHYRSLPTEQRQAFDRLYENFFYVRHNDFWREQAMCKLPALVQATPMLACAEDLGMIPASVPQTLADLQILSLEVQRMPKAYGHEFGHPADYPYLSVCTTSTHDMAGLRGWLADNHDRAIRFIAAEKYSDNAPLKPGDPTPALCRCVIDSHLSSPSMLAIIPIQDYLATDGASRRTDYKAEQINDPANPHHYWCYRMHLPVESLPKMDLSRK